MGNLQIDPLPLDCHHPAAALYLLAFHLANIRVMNLGTGQCPNNHITSNTLHILPPVQEAHLELIQVGLLQKTIGISIVVVAVPVLGHPIHESLKVPLRYYIHLPHPPVHTCPYPQIVEVHV